MSFLSSSVFWNAVTIPHKLDKALRVLQTNFNKNILPQMKFAEGNTQRNINLLRTPVLDEQIVERSRV